jgi:serine/threonine protein kinase
LVVERQVRVLDFGLAVAREHLDEAGDDVVGTLAYMAPEVLEAV